MRKISSLVTDILFEFSGEKYPKLALKYADTFANAEPFPHVVLDDFLPNEIALEIYRGYVEVDDQITHRDNRNTSRKLQQDVGRFSPALRAFAHAVTSREFLLFMETLSGIDCLIPDPYFLGGGAMISENNDFLNIHQDFNWHFQLQLHRRLNALFFLTPGWKPEYGGNLELYDQQKKVREVIPLFNRLVVFATPGANHGQPSPVKGPINLKRRVFSAFFYTSRANDDIWEDPHFTKYLPSNFQLGKKIKSDYEASGLGF